MTVPRPLEPSRRALPLGPFPWGPSLGALPRGLPPGHTTDLA